MNIERISSKYFPKKRETLILQIRWLLNEMDAAINEIEIGNIAEAINILKAETEKNEWLKIT